MRFSVVSSLFALASFASAAYPAFPVAARDTLIVSPDGSCGNVGGVDFTCSGSGFGACCGAMGVCGSDPTSCSLASGCDPAFGNCNDAGASTTTSSTVPPLTSTIPTQTNTSATTVGTPLLQSTTSGTGIISPTFISTTSSMPTGTGVSSGFSGTLLPTGLNSTTPTLGSGTGLPTIISGPTSTPTMTASPSLTSSGSGALMPNVISTLPITNPDVVCYVYTSLVTMTMSA